MSPQIATIICSFFILGLFMLDRDPRARTSKALWIPTIWISIAASRFVSQWTVMIGHPPDTQQQIEGNPLDRAILTGLLLLAVIILLCRQRRVFAILRRNWPILLFFLYCAVSTLWSAYPDVAFRRWFKAVGDLVMVLIVLTDRDRYAAIKKILAWMGFLLIPLSILLIEYYPSIGQQYSPEDVMTSITGVTMNKNTLGCLCLIVGIASVWRLVNLARENSHRMRHCLAHGAILSMVVWLLIMAKSATSTASFLLGSGLIVLVSLPGRRRHARASLLVAGIACVALLIIVIPDAYASVVHVLGRNTTLTDRTELWSVLLAMHTNPWIGTGYESFWIGNHLEKLWSVFLWDPNEAHNGYLEVYLNLGWAGLTLLALLLATGYRNVVTALRRRPEVGSLQLAFFVVALAYNVTEAAFRMFVPLWIFLLWATTALPESRPAEGLNAYAAEEPDQFQNALPIDSPLIQEEVV
jgi:exopolysaccharide production protein ExoQ